MIINFIVTLDVSCLTSPLPAEIQALVEDLRNPTSADIVNHDDAIA